MIMAIMISKCVYWIAMALAVAAKVLVPTYCDPTIIVGEQVVGQFGNIKLTNLWKELMWSGYIWGQWWLVSIFLAMQVWEIWLYGANFSLVTLF